MMEWPTFYFDPLVIAGIAALVATGGLIWIAERALKAFVDRTIEEPATRWRARRLVTVAAWLAFVIMVLGIFGNRLSGFTVFLAVAGVGVAISLRDVFASVAGWFAISFGRIYKIGDRVTIAGVSGDVIDVSLVRTTLMEVSGAGGADSYTGREVTVANHNVFSTPVFNATGETRFVWDELSFSLDYECDWRQARILALNTAQAQLGEVWAANAQAWKEFAKRSMLDEGDLAPRVYMTPRHGFLELTLRYAVDPRRQRAARDSLTVELLSRFSASGVLRPSASAADAYPRPR
jgi:small-conductance mechanosensitive channel